LALSLFSWGYAVDQQPEKALPHCEQVVEIAPEPIFKAGENPFTPEVLAEIRHEFGK
jgi:hypothetical protein